MKKSVGAVWDSPADIAQPIQTIFTQIGLDWLPYYLAGDSHMAPTIFFTFSGYLFKLFH